MSMFKRRMIVRYYRPGGHPATFTYMLAAETHLLVAYRPPDRDESYAGGRGTSCREMHIRDTDDVETALFGAQARIDSHHAGFKAASRLVEMRISREAFEDALVDTGLGGADVRRQIDDALGKGNPVISPSQIAVKQKSDVTTSKFTFNDIAKK